MENKNVVIDYNGDVKLSQDDLGKLFEAWRVTLLSDPNAQLENYRLISHVGGGKTYFDFIKKENAHW